MKILIILAAIFLLLAVIGFFTRDIVLQAVGDFLIINDDLLPADVIFVIAGEDYRTEHAIDLVKQGYGKVIFFTGGWCEGHQYFHGQHGMQLANELGVPLEAIAYDDSPVTSTYSETLLLKEWLDQQSITRPSVIVVSDPFHMRRARWTARQILGDEAEIQTSPVPFDQIPFIRKWWEDEASQRYVKDEYKKFIYYLLRYKYSWGRITEWLASYDTG